MLHVEPLRTSAEPHTVSLNRHIDPTAVLVGVTYCVPLLKQYCCESRILSTEMKPAVWR